MLSIISFVSNVSHRTNEKTAEVEINVIIANPILTIPRYVLKNLKVTKTVGKIVIP